MAWISFRIWNSDELVWLAQVKIFRCVAFEEMRQHLIDSNAEGKQHCITTSHHQLRTGKMIAHPPWTYSGMNLLNCEWYEELTLPVALISHDACIYPHPQKYLSKRGFCMAC
jgi:hypothetical protein